MKASRYNVRVPAPEGGTLLFNAATSALAHLDPADGPVVGHLLEGFLASSDAETGYVATLREQGFLMIEMASYPRERIRGRRASCEDFAACHGACRGITYLHTGRLDASFPVCLKPRRRAGADRPPSPGAP